MDTKRILALLDDLDKVIDELMPGAKHLCGVDFMHLNNALCEAREVKEALEAEEGAGLAFNDLQARADKWVHECFGPVIAADVMERCDRYIEESIELVQSLGYPKERIDVLRDYVYNREVGETSQEVAGSVVTLTALCNAVNVNMSNAVEAELDRIESPEIIEKIRKKQQSKPHPDSPLPQPV